MSLFGRTRRREAEMGRTLVALVLAGSLVAGLAHSATASSTAESARITITKVTIRGGNATVKVAITGFPSTRGHWDLAYKLLGTSSGFSDKVHVRRGTVAQPFTNFQSGERWRLTASLVNNAHTKVYASSSKVVRVR
jgi:hypothetical protein